MDIVNDLRVAARSLRRSPGFAAAAALTLALGISATTAVFSLLNAIFLRPPSFGEPNRLVRVYGEQKRSRQLGVLSWPNARDLGERVTAFQDLTAHQHTQVQLGTPEAGRFAEAEVVSGRYFQVLEVSPLFGRVLVPDDDVPPAGRAVVVVSHRFWVRELGGAPDGVGRTLELNGHPFQVVGVMPPSFRGSFEAAPADLWAPLHAQVWLRPRGLDLERRGWGFLYATARLRPGRTLEDARAEVTTVAAQMRKEGLLDDDSFGLTPVAALAEQEARAIRRVVPILGAIALVGLLAACANVGGLLLARGNARRRELATRQSLGASRARLVRHSLAESAVLAVAGAALGLLLSRWTSTALVALAPPELGLILPDATLDPRLVAFSLVALLLTTVACGIAPALLAARLEPAVQLRAGDGGRVASGSQLGGLFLAGQVTASTLLLVLALLLGRSLRASLGADPGFDPTGLAVASVPLERHGYDEARARVFFAGLLERARALPGVEAATLASVVPLGLGEDVTQVRSASNDRDEPVRTGINVVGDGYFAFMGIPLVEGRGFEAGLAAGGARQVVVNRTLARRFWPDRPALGQRVLVEGREAEVVGVARDIAYYALGEAPRPFVYLPLAQFPTANLTLHVRATTPGDAMLAAVRHAIAALDPSVVPVDVMSFARLRALPLFPARVLGLSTAVLGAFAMAFGAVGLYGLLAYAVSQRTREIGVRIALGARPSAVFRLFVGRGLRPVAVGLMAGALMAGLVATRLGDVLFGVGPFDLPTYAVVTLVQLAVALLAGTLPARRASRVDPAVVLRGE
jgi:putative ABC transport system permease protein